MAFQSSRREYGSVDLISYLGHVRVIIEAKKCETGDYTAENIKMITQVRKYLAYLKTAWSKLRLGQGVRE